MMKRTAIITNITFALLALGCAKKITYQHVVFDEKPNLQVLEKSFDTVKRSNGQPVKNQISGLPVHLRLTRENYSIDILTPTNIEPVVFIAVASSENKHLQIVGPHIKAIEGDHPYSFLVREAKSDPLHVEIMDQTGSRVGIEDLPFKLVTRCSFYVIDAL